MRSASMLCCTALLLSLTAQASETCPMAPARVKSEDQAVERVAKAVETYKLGRLKLECMAFSATKNKTGFAVDIREIHNEACGGDPMTEPRAFSVEVASNGGMKTDVYDHANYRPLICPKA